jgi:hypothetical protein
MLFRCSHCPKAFCEDHLPLDANIIKKNVRTRTGALGSICPYIAIQKLTSVPVRRLQDRFLALGQRHPSQACFVICTTRPRQSLSREIYLPKMTSHRGLRNVSLVKCCGVYRLGHLQRVRGDRTGRRECAGGAKGCRQHRRRGEYQVCAYPFDFPRSAQ